MLSSYMIMYNASSSDNCTCVEGRCMQLEDP